jgi:hypothetical protein
MSKNPGHDDPPGGARHDYASGDKREPFSHEKAELVLFDGGRDDIVNDVESGGKEFITGTYHLTRSNTGTLHLTRVDERWTLDVPLVSAVATDTDLTPSGVPLLTGEDLYQALSKNLIVQHSRQFVIINMETKDYCVGEDFFDTQEQFEARFGKLARGYARRIGGHLGEL